MATTAAWSDGAKVAAAAAPDVGSGYIYWLPLLPAELDTPTMPIKVRLEGKSKDLGFLA